MSIVSQVIIGALGAFIGYLIVRYAGAIYSMVGRVGFAEKWFGTFGGTRLFIRFIGILTIFFSFLIMTGLMGPSIKNFLNLFFKGKYKT